MSTTKTTCDNVSKIVHLENLENCNPKSNKVMKKIALAAASGFLALLITSAIVAYVNFTKNIDYPTPFEIGLAAGTSTFLVVTTGLFVPPYVARKVRQWLDEQEIDEDEDSISSNQEKTHSRRSNVADMLINPHKKQRF